MALPFNITVCGKWILAGEHAVLRGHPALVFPLQSRSLTLEHRSNGKTVHAEFCGGHPENLQLLLWGVLERGMEIIDKSHNEISGHFKVINHIPLGVGMGASAALCVAVGHWFIAQHWIRDTELYDFARELENLFHGESSGVDISVAIAETGLRFQHNTTSKAVQLAWQPAWYLSDTQQVGITSNAIKKVKELWTQKPELAQRIDNDMADATQMALHALQQSQAIGLPLLTNAINKAHLCFRQWGLAAGKVEQHINHLLEAGALAAKPTGAGDGGFVLSLWPHLIEPDKAPAKMIQL